MNSNPYTVADHKAFVNQLSILEPNIFREREKKNILKRQMEGDLCLDHNEPKSLKLQEQIKFEFIETCRPELDSPMFSGTVLKFTNRKRKLCETQTFSEKQLEWSDILTKNLSSCDQAIQIQNFVLQAMTDNSLLLPTKQSFLKIEQESAKLASVDKCTSGTFICTVFKCLIQEKEIFYVRYFESGVYSGFMLQKYVQLLKEQYNALDDDFMLHNVITLEDISDMTKRNAATTKRQRADKTLSYSLQKVLPVQVNELNEFGECAELKLDAFVVHILPFKSKVTLDISEKTYHQVKNGPIECLKPLFLDFRMNRQEPVVISSKDILNEPQSPISTLLQQSITLNCLSGDIRRQPHLFRRRARFESNLLNFTFVNDATSLRNRTIQLYLQNDVYQLIAFYMKYFPELSGKSKENNESDVDQRLVKIQKGVLTTMKKTKQVSVCNNNLCSLPFQTKELHENPMSIFDSYCLSLLEHGKMVIQIYEPLSNLVCCMNDYSEVDGSFRYSDFIHTVKQVQETGDYFYCSCKTFHTLVNLKECKSNDQDFLVMDSSGENCVTCIHCKFLKQKVVPALEMGENDDSKLQRFVQESLKFKNNEIAEIYRNKDTRKYSITASDEDIPSFVHLTNNKRLGKFLITCFNSRCVSLKGHKRVMNTLINADVCKHLTIFKSTLNTGMTY